MKIVGERDVCLFIKFRFGEALAVLEIMQSEIGRVFADVVAFEQAPRFTRIEYAARLIQHRDIRNTNIDDGAEKLIGPDDRKIGDRWGRWSQQARGHCSCQLSV